ncbi:MAG TPA: F0F1 ATP synthase subunit A [Caldilineaceae bacterium]|nr:F0F1 ATP synthase subunit A [Caldilineaceae bacterium]
MNFINENPRRAMIIGGALVLIIISFFIPVPQPHVSIAAEPIFESGYSWLTNGLLTTFIVDIVLILIAYFATRKMNLVPSGLQNLMEAVIEYLYGLAEGVAGKAASTYFPWAATIFLLVVISNWSGLIPGMGSIGFFHSGEHAVEGAEEHGALLDQQIAMVDGNLLLVQSADAAAQEEAEHGEDAGHEKFVPLFRAPSADLNMTLALALATMVMVQIHGIRALGGGYFRKFWNTSGKGAMKGINIFVSLLEIISEFSRIIAFTFRLFGNIFAGEVILATMAFLVAFLVPLPFYLLEILVGAVQALVFMMLALAFFTMATISHAEEHH